MSKARLTSTRCSDRIADNPYSLCFYPTDFALSVLLDSPTCKRRVRVSGGVLASVVAVNNSIEPLRDDPDADTERGRYVCAYLGGASTGPGPSPRRPPEALHRGTETVSGTWKVAVTWAPGLPFVTAPAGLRRGEIARIRANPVDYVPADACAEDPAPGCV